MSLYDDENASPSQPNEDGNENEPGMGEEQEDGQKALVNNELCPKAKEGDVLKVRVTRKMDSEMEVEYLGMDEGGDEQPSGEPNPDEAMMAHGRSLMD